MSTENIVITVTETGARQVSRNIDAIGDSANKASSQVDKMIKILKQLDQAANLLRATATQVQALNNVLARNAEIMARVDIANARSALQQQKLTAAVNAAAAAQAAAQNRIIASAAAAAAAQARQAAAASQAAAAADRAALSAIRLSAAQDQASGAASRHNATLDGLKATLMSFAATIGIKSILDMADSWIQAEGKVNIFTHSAAETAVVMDRLYEIAQKTRQPIDGVAASFHQLSIAGSALGATQNQLLQFTQAVGNALAIQGTDSNTARGGIIQLGQAMNEGIVRAQEYNSMINAMPIVLKTVAKNLDGAHGSLAALRQMMLAGKLTSKDFFEALLRGQGDLEKMFDRSGKTFGQAFTVIQNGLKRYIGQMNEASGASRIFYDAAKGVADNINNIVKALIALAAPRIIAGLYAVTLQLRAMAVAAAANPYVTLAAALTALVTAAILYQDQIIILQKEQVTLGDYMSATWDLAKEGISTASDFLKGAFATAVNVVSDLIPGLGQAFTDAGKVIVMNVNSMIGTFTGFGKSVGIIAAGITDAFKDAAIQSGNGIIQYLQDAINKTIALSNSVREKVGLDPFENVSIGQIDNPYAGRAKEMASAVKDAFSDSMSTDYIGELGDSMSTMLDKYNDKAIQAAEQRRKEAKEQQDLLNEVNLDQKNGDGENFAGKTKLSAAEKAAERARISLAKYVATQQASTDAANGMAAAYLLGTDAVSKYTRQQEIDEQVAKRGKIARDAVTKAINDNHDALERLDLAKTIDQTKIQTTDIAAQIAVVKAQTASVSGGKTAQDAYNVTKAITIALSGKNKSALSLETALYKEQLEELNKQQRALEAANEIKGLVDSTATAQEKYNKELEHFNSLKPYADTPEQLEAINRALVNVKNEYSVWSKLTEGAIDRIDSAFADMWKGVFDGTKSTLDGMKNAIKQWLAEVANMLITKPLLVSIGNTLLGTNKAGGIADVWSQLTSSGSGTSGGLSLGSLANAASTAYSVVTGVGPAASAGYASGGFTGAAQGIANYYSGLASSAVNSISSWFTSAGGTAAATAVGQTAAQAAVASAAGQGAATTGYGYGTSLVAGEVGSATYAAPASSGAAAYVWPLAILMGMYQSGKLYDQGVRYDKDAIEGSKLSQLGDKLGTAGLDRKLAFESIGLADKALSGLFGGKAGAILSGSTFAMAIEGYISSKLFGTGYQTKDAGLSLQVNNGDLEAQNYQDQKKKKGLLGGSNKKRTIYSALDDDQEQQLQELYAATQIGVIELVKQIGVTVEDGAFDGMKVAEMKISTQGKTQEEIQKAVSDWFSYASDVMVATLDKGVGGFGYSFAELARRINVFTGFNAQLDLIGVKMFKLSAESMEFANAMVEAAGGTEAMTANINAYYDAFFTESERSIKGLSSIEEQFAAMNVVLPETREGYRDMISALDLTTTAGQDMFIKLTAAAATADQAYKVLEAGQKTYYEAFYSEAENAKMSMDSITAEFKKANLTLPATRDGYRAMVDGIDRTTESGRKMYESLMVMSGSADTFYKAQEDAAASAAAATKTLLDNNVNSAMSALQRAIAAEKQALTDAYNKQTEALNSSLSAANDVVSNLTSLTNNLKSALSKLLSQSSEATQVLYKQGVATLTSAVAIARAGGSLSGLTGIEDALNAVSSNNTDNYADWESFAKDQGIATNLIDELNNKAGGQLTAAQIQINTLKDMLDQLKLKYDADMKALDDELQRWQTEMDKLNGIDTSVLSVKDAVTAMGAAIAAAIAASKPATPAGSTGGYTGGTGTVGAPSYNDINAIYNSVLGRDADAAGSIYWGGQAANMTADQLAAAIKADAIANGELKGKAMGGYASGMFIAGEMGPEIIDMSRGYVHTAMDSRSMLATNSDETNSILNEVLAALLDLRELQEQSTINVAKSTRSLQNIEDQQAMSDFEV